MAITSYEPLRLHLYEEGLVRFATEQYHNSRYCLNNHFMHLTNYSINRRNRNFVENQDAEADDYGNKWSLTALKRFLAKRHVPVDVLFERIDDLIIKTAISIEPQVIANLRMWMPHRANCFQLLGFDVFIDDSLKPWLLEVNLGPSLAADAPLDWKVKTSMVADLLSLCGFQPYNKSSLREAQRHAAVLARERLSRGHPARADRGERASMLAAGASVESDGATSTGGALAPESRLLEPDPPALADEASYPAELRRALRECDESEARGGGWRRLFPTANSHHYLAFFDVFRPANAALADAYLRRHQAAVRRARRAPQPREVAPEEGPDVPTALARAGGDGPSDGGRSAAPLAANGTPENGPDGHATGVRHEEPKRSPPRSEESGVISPLIRRRAKSPGAAGEVAAATSALATAARDRRQPTSGHQRQPPPVSLSGEGALPDKDMPQELRGPLTPIQARDAFAAYLRRVQAKLRSELAILDDRDKRALTSHEAGQMDRRLDVIERLVTRHSCPVPAAAEPTPAEGPGLSAPLDEVSRRRHRCHVLAQRLASYMATYEAQTDRLISRETADRSTSPRVDRSTTTTSPPSRVGDRALVRAWLDAASDSDLEALLARFISDTGRGSIAASHAGRASSQPPSTGAGGGEENPSRDPEKATRPVAAPVPPLRAASLARTRPWSASTTASTSSRSSRVGRVGADGGVAAAALSARNTVRGRPSPQQGSRLLAGALPASRAQSAGTPIDRDRAGPRPAILTGAAWKRVSPGPVQAWSMDTSGPGAAGGLPLSGKAAGGGAIPSMQQTMAYPLGYDRFRMYRR